VLRVEDNGRHAFIGIGFQERNDAFDFNVALQDFVRQTKAASQPIQKPQPIAPLDLALKEGEVISINIGGRSKKSTSKSTLVVSDKTPFILPPPPSSNKPPSPQTAPSNPQRNGKDVFGSFHSAMAVGDTANSNEKPTVGVSNWVQF